MGTRQKQQSISLVFSALYIKKEAISSLHVLLEKNKGKEVLRDER